MFSSGSVPLTRCRTTWAQTSRWKTFSGIHWGSTHHTAGAHWWVGWGTHIQVHLTRKQLCRSTWLRKYKTEINWNLRATIPGLSHPFYYYYLFIFTVWHVTHKNRYVSYWDFIWQINQKFWKIIKLKDHDNFLKLRFSNFTTFTATPALLSPHYSTVEAWSDTIRRICEQFLALTDLFTLV